MIYLIFIDVFCDYIVCTFIVFISYINPCTRIIFAIQILKKNVIFIITFIHIYAFCALQIKKMKKIS